MNLSLKCPNLSITDNQKAYTNKMKGRRQGMLNYQPVDQSLSQQHQVVTAIGEAPLLYGNQHMPIVVEDDEEDDVDPHFSEDHSFPAKRISYQPAKPSSHVTSEKIPVNIIKPAKFKPEEIDVSSKTFENVPVSLKEKRKIYDVEEVIDIDEEATPENLNIQLRKNDPWIDAIIRSGKKEDYLYPSNPNHFSLREDNFRDYDHLNSRLYDEYLKGFVVLGTTKAVSSLLDHVDKDKSLGYGTHGVIVDQSMPPSYDGLFEEGEGQQYKLMKQLGTGSFGTVTFCQHYLGQEYVRKVITDKFDRKEVEILMHLSHPNITQFRGYIFRDKVHEILMEYGGDSLKTLMEKNKRNFQEVFTCDVVQELSLQGFSALEYMYDRFGILHLDIKPENTCVQLNPPTLKITDFGTSKTPQQAINYNGWTPEYMSPEACRLILTQAIPNPPPGFTEELTGKTDVFSFGLVICFMLTGTHSVCTLWPKEFTAETFMKWRSDYIKHLAVNPEFLQQIAVKDEWPKEIRDLLCTVLAGRTQERMTARDACHYIRQQVNIPTLLSAGSPSSPAASDLTTTDSMFEAPPSPLDVSLALPPGGGKDIKNQLRRKIRRKSAAPYERQISSVVAVKEKTEPVVGGLPIFAELGLDD